MKRWIHRLKALALLPVLFLCSCATYNQQASEFYSNLEKGDYEKASKSLDHNRLLKKQRNRLLFLLEKGRVEHLRGNFRNSNIYLEEADLLMEDGSLSARDVLAGTLINPMMQRYRGEDFEKYMVHYYKALNYLQLNETEEALVEARRISIRSYAQEDVKKGDRYSGDAFSFMLQGLIYEAAGDINNAFIAYRNATDLYLSRNLVFYGTQMPQQLKKDLLRMAWKNGFYDELERYEKLLGITWNREEADSAGSLVVFWESGMAPVKVEQQLFFNLYDAGNGEFFFHDEQRRYKVPFDRASGFDRSRIDLARLHSFRITIPRYEVKRLQHRTGTILCNETQFSLEAAQNISELATATLQERWLKELSKTLTRLAIKKLAEEAAKPDKDEKDKKKKNRQEALAMGIKLFSVASEKADTRNWQSLPHTIHYTRIPLSSGTNEVSLNLGGSNETIQVQSRNGIQFRTVTTR